MRRRNKPLDRWMRLLGSASVDTRRVAIESIHRHASRGISGSRCPLFSKRQIDQLFARLVFALEHDADGVVRHQAAHFLSHWSDGRAVRALLRVLGRPSEEPHIRGQAAEGIGDALSKMENANYSLREDAVLALRAALGDPAAEVRFWTVRALGIMRAEEARPALEVLAREDTAIAPQMWSVKVEAADALAFMATGNWPFRSGEQGHIE